MARQGSFRGQERIIVDKCASRKYTYLSAGSKLSHRELPMLINMTDVLTVEGKKEELQSPLPAESFCYGGEEYTIDAHPQVTLTLTNIGTRRASVACHSSFGITTVCNRCLKAVTVPVEMDFTHEITAPEAATGDSFSDDESFMNGYILQADELIFHELLLLLPAKVLCREDCRGLCPVCGQDLNEQECGCDRFVPDPRLAALKQLFPSATAGSGLSDFKEGNKGN